MTPPPTMNHESNPGRSGEELREIWSPLAPDDKLEAFRAMDSSESDDFFLNLKAIDQAELIEVMNTGERRKWLRILQPDDLADMIQEISSEAGRANVVGELEPKARKEVIALLAYAEDQAGGLMNPRFARLRSDMLVGEAISYLRRQALEDLETMGYIYVIAADQRPVGVVSLRELFLAKDDRPVREIMTTDLVTALSNMDEQDLKAMFRNYGLMAIPIVDQDGRMKGIVTVDDIVDVVEDTATEDMQKMAGVKALDAPYLKLNMVEMVQKRAGWLTALFVGEMFTATAMGHYEHKIQQAVVLALFIPLIISSGGNSGSQASTLVVRALALGELHLRDWWRVFFKEIVVGLALGLILGSVGLLRILLWPTREALYGPHYVRIGLAVSLSLVGIVLWGSLSGSMLPFLLRKLKLDPATASAPFVATIVDVSGIIIYFTIATAMLKGIML